MESSNNVNLWVFDKAVLFSTDFTHSHTLGQVCLLVKVIQGLDSYAFIVNFEQILVYCGITSLHFY